MSPILYHSVLSPPSRAVLLTMRNLDLDEFEVKNIDLHMDELNPPEYLTIEELHRVPVYIDGDFILTESRAIICYLASSMNKFYPKDLKKRALVDSRLYFDGTNSFAIIRDFWLPAFRGKRKILSDQREAIKVLLSTLESFLLQSNWFAGDDLTIADLSFLATVATIKAWGVNLKEYPKLNNWHNRCKLLPGFLENQKGAKFLSTELSILVNGPLWPDDTNDASFEVYQARHHKT